MNTRTSPHNPPTTQPLESMEDDQEAAKLLVGCFVRVVLGVTNQATGKRRKVGRIARIEGTMDAHDGEDEYPLPGGGTSSRRLKVSYDGQSAILKVTEISSEVFSKDQIESFRRSCIANDVPLPELEDLREKRQECRNYLARKRRMGGGGLAHLAGAPIGGTFMPPFRPPLPRSSAPGPPTAEGLPPSSNPPLPRLPPTAAPMPPAAPPSA